MNFGDPTTITIVQIVGLGALGIFTAFGHWYGKNSRGGGSGPPQSKDVVIPALTIADNQIIMDAAKTLREANDHSRDRQQFERDTLEVFRELLVLHRQVARDMNDAKHSLERIERNQNPPSPPERVRTR